MPRPKRASKAASKATSSPYPPRVSGSAKSVTTIPSAGNRKIQEALAKRLEEVDDQFRADYVEMVNKTYEEMSEAKKGPIRWPREKGWEPRLREDFDDINTESYLQRGFPVEEIDRVMAKSAVPVGLAPPPPPPPVPPLPPAAPAYVAPGAPGWNPLGNFSRLSAEIRIMIYDEIFPAGRRVQRLQRHAPGQPDRYGLSLRPAPPWISIILASSVLRDEALAVLYSRNNVIIHANLLDESLRDPIDTFPLVFRNTARRLTFAWDYADSDAVKLGRQPGINFPPGWTTRRSRQQRGLPRNQPIDPRQPYPMGQWYGKVAKHTITVDGQYQQTITIFSDFPNTRPLCLDAWLPIFNRVDAVDYWHYFDCHIAREFSRSQLWWKYSFQANDPHARGVGSTNMMSNQPFILPQAANPPLPRGIPLKTRAEKQLLQQLLENGAFYYDMQRLVNNPHWLHLHAFDLRWGPIIVPNDHDTLFWMWQMRQAEQLIVETHMLDPRNWDPDFQTRVNVGVVFPPPVIPRTGKGSRAFRLD